LARRITAGMPPIIQTDSKRNRVVIPFHCPNKFVVKPLNPADDVTSAPASDQFSQGTLVYAFPLDSNVDTNDEVQVQYQYGDGFRMSHYRPKTYIITGVQSNPSSSAYLNYYGQNFATLSG